MESFLLHRSTVVPSQNLIRREGLSVRVTPKEMAVLMRLVESPGDVVSRTQLLDSVWSDVVVREDAPTLSISRLRKALGDESRSPSIIQTIPKKGYRLLAVPKPTATHAETQGQTQGQETLRRPARQGIWIAIMAAISVVLLLLYLLARINYGEARQLSELQELSRPAPQGGLPGLELLSLDPWAHT